MKVLVIVLIILVFLFGFLIAKEISVMNNECLKEKAIDYCEDEGLFYNMHNNYFSPIFCCKENERLVDTTCFLFTKEEKKECL